jgi:hypothetical protein
VENPNKIEYYSCIPQKKNFNHSDSVKTCNKRKEAHLIRQKDIKEKLISVFCTLKEEEEEEENKKKV